ncbi:hypothetical protein IHE44_0009399 [Lamprotornis superbus]|uniref:Syntaxin-7 n=1 Tax=Lamprotornis superbus TaxID=245042 RepID=A0A835U167_9PASS|nr:hypothetical protein IHE44_0009399 [Lamprotornis superbus]
MRPVTYSVTNRQQKQQYTNQLAKETDKYIKEFGSLPATSEQRQRKIQKDRLVGEFTTALTNFQRLQRQAAEKEKDFVARGGAPEDNYKEGTLVSWDSQPQAQVQDEEITEDDLRLIEERESSIRQLEADIMDINEIFKDLGMMIHEQGDMIDSIEANVENADVHVQQANQQLSRAANYQEAVSTSSIVQLIIHFPLYAVTCAHNPSLEAQLSSGQLQRILADLAVLSLDVIDPLMTMSIAQSFQGSI